MATDIQTKYKSLFQSYYLNTELRSDHFMAQITHESALKLVREDLYYKDISRLRLIFYTPFKGKTDKFVSQYLRNPQKLANYVYANRMGNGDEASGDGWKYRAGGYLGITGKSQYLLLSKDTRIDFMTNPDIINQEANSLISALWYWNKHKLNDYADKDNLDAISDIINIGRITAKYGDSNGFEDRKKLLAYYKKLGELRWKKDRQAKEDKLVAKFLPILNKGGDNEKVAVLLAKVALKK